MSTIDRNYSTEEHSKINGYSLANTNNEVRNYLNRFDLAVNPFINKMVKEKDLKNVNIYGANDYIGVSLIIEDKNTNNKTIYIENKEGFNFKLEYSNESLASAEASHYMENGKEFFDIVDNGLETKYNLTDKTVLQNKTVYNLDAKNILTMCKCLNYVETLASTITLDNMERTKKLVIS